MKQIKYIKARIIIRILVIIGLLSASIVLIKNDIKDLNIATESYKEKIIRFHVLANSNSDEDQELKLKVRDEVINYLQPKLIESKSIEESEEIIKTNYSELEKISKEIIDDSGYDYEVSVNLEYSKFPTKQYSSVVLPSGEYKALRVVIGDGEGKNWWCVMFPPLCFVDESNNVIDESTDEQMHDILTEDEYDLVVKKEKGEVTQTEFKFKILEVFESIEEMFS